VKSGVIMVSVGSNRWPSIDGTSPAAYGSARAHSRVCARTPTLTSSSSLLMIVDINDSTLASRDAGTTRDARQHRTIACHVTTCRAKVGEHSLEQRRQKG
jgi:hypothetical protein